VRRQRQVGSMDASGLVLHTRAVQMTGCCIQELCVSRGEGHTGMANGIGRRGYGGGRWGWAPNDLVMHTKSCASIAVEDMG
jgi:hypothetical protein